MNQNEKALADAKQWRQRVWTQSFGESGHFVSAESAFEVVDSLIDAIESQPVASEGVTVVGDEYYLIRHAVNQTSDEDMADPLSEEEIETVHAIRKYLKTIAQPVAGQVDLSDIPRWTTRAVAEMEDNPDGEDFGPWMREQDAITIIGSQQPQAPSVEVTFCDINRAYNEGSTSVMLKYDPHEVPLEALGVAHQAGIQRILALLTKGAHS